MARARKKLLFLTPQKWNEIWGVLLLFAGTVLFLSIISYHPGDLPFFTTQVSPEPQNLCGKVGAWIAGLARSGLGWTSFLLPVLAVLWALAFFNGAAVQRSGLKLGTILLLCVSVSGFLSIVWTQAPEARVQRGGVVGVLVGNQVVQYFGWWGATAVLLTVGLICLIVSTEMTVWPLLKGGGEAAGAAGRWLGRRVADSAAGVWKGWTTRKTEQSRPTSQRAIQRLRRVRWQTVLPVPQIQCRAVTDPAEPRAASSPSPVADSRSPAGSRGRGVRTG